MVVLLCAFTLKLYYSTASVDQLGWILAPTTFLVELVSGTSFEFEAHAGYMSSDRSFLIAASCAGVNFLIAAFLMLSLGELFKRRSQKIAWGLIPLMALFAYIATLIANAARICAALWLRPVEISWLSPEQLHRLEGIFIYFCFLMLLFVVSEKMRKGAFWQLLLPLLIYYGVALGIPLANGAYRTGTEFWEHSVLVLLTPLPVILFVVLVRFCRAQRVVGTTMELL